MVDRVVAAAGVLKIAVSFLIFILNRKSMASRGTAGPSACHWTMAPLTYPPPLGHGSFPLCQR
jgi:hypothetical protein